MNKDQIKLIIFDVDETLTRVNSWQYLTKKLGIDPKENLAIYEDFAAKKITKKEGIRQVTDLWNRDKIRTKSEIETVFDTIQPKPNAAKTVKYLKSKYEVIIISGSMDLLVKRVANKTGIEEWHALAELEFNENQELVTFTYSDNESEGKYELFQKLAKRKNIGSENVVMVGDGNSDIRMFRELSTAILVKKDSDQSKLEPFADYTITNLSEIKNIL